MDTILNQFHSHNPFVSYTCQILLCLPCICLSPALNVRVCSLLCNKEIPFTYSFRKSWRDFFPTTSCPLRWKKVFLRHKQQFQTGHYVTCSLPGSFACQRIIEATVCVETVALWKALVQACYSGFDLLCGDHIKNQLKRGQSYTWPHRWSHVRGRAS